MTKSPLYCYNWGFFRYSSRRFYSPGKCLDHCTISKCYVLMTTFYFDGAVQILPLLINFWVDHEFTVWGKGRCVYDKSLLIQISRKQIGFFAEWPIQEKKKHVYKPLLFCFLIKKLWIKHVHFLVILKNAGKHDILFSPLLFSVPGKVGTVQ